MYKVWMFLSGDTVGFSIHFACSWNSWRERRQSLSSHCKTRVIEDVHKKVIPCHSKCGTLKNLNGFMAIWVQSIGKIRSLSVVCKTLLYSKILACDEYSISSNVSAISCDVFCWGFALLPPLMNFKNYNKDIKQIKKREKVKKLYICLYFVWFFEKFLTSRLIYVWGRYLAAKTTWPVTDLFTVQLKGKL